MQSHCILKQQMISDKSGRVCRVENIYPILDFLLFKNSTIIYQLLEAKYQGVSTKDDILFPSWVSIMIKTSKSDTEVREQEATSQGDHL